MFHLNLSKQTGVGLKRLVSAVSIAALCQTVFTGNAFVSGAYADPVQGIQQTEVPQSVNEEIPANSVWKYFDLGTNPGEGWNTTAFDDAAWQSGAGELGYGDGDEATVLGFGPNSRDKYPAYYFRRSFQIGNPDVIGELNIRLLRDDGAVLYVNGQEILRNNMPEGEITHQTYANGTVDGSAERTYLEFRIPAQALVEGENVFAVSIHQDRPTSSDISFDLAMTYTLAQNENIEAGSVWKYLDDGTDPGTAWRNPGFNDSAWQSGAGELGYGDGGEATVLGFGPNSSDKYPAYFFRRTFIVGDAASVDTIRLGLLRDDGAIVYLNGVELLRNNLPEGEIGYRTYANGTVAGDAETIYLEYTLPADALIDGVNTLAVSVHQDRPTSSDVSFDLWMELISAADPENEGIMTGSVWKYNDNGTDPGEGWRTLEFDDSSWESGPAQLGYGDNDEATVLSFGGNSSSKYPAYFFRHVFRVSDAEQVKNLAVRLLRDDGAVLYLNGQELLRDNMPAGEITHQTWASGTVDGANERTFFEYTLPATALVTGDNVLAVSIHQDRPSSSDISFDMELKLVPKPHQDAPVFNDDVVSTIDAIINNVYVGTLADLVTDANGDPIFFTKISGPDWLIINEDGTLSGTPGASNIGLNEFVVEVTDNNDGTTRAVLQITVAEAPELARAPLPLLENSLRFGIIPDTQGSTNGVPTAEARAVTEQLLLQKPEFAIHVGDVTDSNHSGNSKMVELNYFNQLMTDPLQEAGILIYPVRGNHDANVHTLTSDNIPVWQAAFPYLFTGSTALIDPTDVPGGSVASPNANNYSFVFNPTPDTYIIGLDMWQGGTNSNYSDWVAAKMAEIRAQNPDAHIFGYSHSGLYASANHPAMTQYIGSPSDFIAAGHANQIDGWFSGHNHIYDRSMAVDTANGDRAAFFNITVGSASNKFYTLSRSPVEGQHIGRIIDSTKIANRPLAYQMVTINGSFVTITTYMSPKNAAGSFSEWTVWDEFTYSNKGDKFTIASGQNYNDRNVASESPAGDAFIGTTARIIDGVNSDATVHVAGNNSFTQYRTISLGWWALADWHADDSRQIVSDVVSIHGMRDVPGRNRADAYTLVLGFDASLSPIHRANLSIVAFLDENADDDSVGNWVDAAAATLGAVASEPVFRAPLESDAIGTWGIDLENNEVWARLDYQGDFAVASNVIDSDNDGLADEWEMFYFGTLEYGAEDDPDGDGLTNAQEQMLGTDPTRWDSDGDLIGDGVEYNNGLNPLEPNTAITDSILDAIRNNAALQASVGLYTPQSLGALSAAPLIELDGSGNVTLRVRIQESTDMQEWNPIAEEVLLTVPVSENGKKFFRLIAR